MPRPRGPYHSSLYTNRRWRRRARLEKAANPVCKRCEQAGIIVPAEVSHHLEDHGGNALKFFAGPVMSLCRRCHELTHNRGDRRNFSLAIGADGFPIDPAHEFYRGELRSVNAAKLKAARRKKR
jgi:5-methylcytosine-specific restriction protein A